ACQKSSNDFRAAVRARERERRHAEVVDDVWIGASPEQQVDQIEVVPVGCPMKSGRPVVLPRVDVDVLLQEGAGGFRVVGLNGIDQPHIRAGGGQADHGQGTQQQRQPRERRLDGARARTMTGLVHATTVRTTDHYTPDRYSTRPVLSPIASAGTPSLSSTVTNRFVTGRSSVKRR